MSGEGTIGMNGVTLWTAHFVEIPGERLAQAWEFARVYVGADDALAAAPFWLDRDVKLILPANCTPTHEEATIGMHVGADILLYWLRHTLPIAGGGDGRGMLTALLVQCELERDLGQRNAVQVYLRGWP